MELGLAELLGLVEGVVLVAIAWIYVIADSHPLVVAATPIVAVDLGVVVGTLGLVQLAGGIVLARVDGADILTLVLLLFLALLTGLHLA